MKSRFETNGDHTEAVAIVPVTGNDLPPKVRQLAGFIDPPETITKKDVRIVHTVYIDEEDLTVNQTTDLQVFSIDLGKEDEPSWTMWYPTPHHAARMQSDLWGVLAHKAPQVLREADEIEARWDKDLEEVRDEC